MDAWTTPRVTSSPSTEPSYDRWFSRLTEPSARAILNALAISIIFVIGTRLPVARPAPLEWDEFEFLSQTGMYWFPMHHTLFLTLGRLVGLVAQSRYQGFIWLDMFCSAGALVAAWWWLRAIVPPVLAGAATLVLGVSPVFWTYGAMAGNYTAIVLVGSLLLGIAYRGLSRPAAWHPFAAAVALAIGNGYRSDLGTLWLPVFAVILWQHRWKRGFGAACVFAVVNLGWLLPMLYDVGGWTRYRQASSEFAYQAGYLSSVWNLGVIDSPARNAVKIAMALVWTLGPGLIFASRGVVAMPKLEKGIVLLLLMLLSVVPAFVSHLLVQFGVQGYGFHYIPALLGLMALGAAKAKSGDVCKPAATGAVIDSLKAAAWLGLIASCLAAVFWFYPTNYGAPGFQGSFDLAFSRFTRVGLRTPMPGHSPSYWRTANSRQVAGTDAYRTGSG
jgi:hypothetical protein